MHRVFFLEPFKANDTLTLSDSEAHHLLKVLRVEVGENLQLFDGKGSVAAAEVVEVSKKACVVEVKSVLKVEQNCRVQLAFGVAKGQALDFILHRCTELGVAEFHPLLTEHSLSPSSWNSERWMKVLIEVCKQCQMPYLPIVHEPIRLTDWLKVRSKNSLLLFCDEEKREKNEIFVPAGSGVDLLVGAEGGWSESERKQIEEAGAQTLSLGKNRLRAETATLVGLTLAKKFIGEI